MRVVKEQGRAPIKMWTDGVPVEEQAMNQLRNVASMPFIHKHIAVMPDVHWGMGATIGSVVPTLGAIIPAAVGVDIGCGMMAMKLGITAEQLPDSLTAIRAAIEAAIPVGFNDHGKPEFRHSNGVQTVMSPQSQYDLRYILEKHFKKDVASLTQKAHNQLGTLGGGNHFIEICLDENNEVWAMLHSGSRGIGNRIGTHFIATAREQMEKMFINLPDRDLAYLAEGTNQYKDYMIALSFAQGYASDNRKAMRVLLLNVLRKAGIKTNPLGHLVSCHHNYVSREYHFGEEVLVTRKGAVSAKAGEWGIIPGSMGTRSYIVMGLGNAESFHSCSHGAGRVMSRGAAKRAISMEEHAEATKGVECRKDEGVLDESPAAYKDIDAVMAAQADLVEVKHTLKQILCVKG